MNKKILIAAGLLSLAAVAVATLSSYGSVTGYATVEQAITIDIMGSSNDEFYNLNTVYQGDTEYSPEIKLVNKADKTIDVNILLQSSANESDVTLSLVNEFKNETLTNPISVPTTDMRFRVKHGFKNNANLGNYTFVVSVNPV